MTEVLNPYELNLPLVAAPDERAARRSLRDQITKLEREIASAFVAARGKVGAQPIDRERSHGPRVLSLAELEMMRDRLAIRLGHMRADLAEQAEVHEQNRLLVERMLLAPGQYKWVKITAADVGEQSCRAWHVRPRLGIIGMMMGWWQVKISAGCPLATGARPKSAIIL